MPMNRYKCIKCNSEFVKLAKFTDISTTCDECGGKAVKIMPKRVLSQIVDRTGWTKTSLPGSYSPIYSRSEKTIGKAPSEV